MKLAPLLIVIAQLLFALLLAPAVCAAEDVAQVAETVIPVEESDALGTMISYALSLTGTPYKYGGTLPETGFDCSGFVSYVFRQTMGIELPHRAREIKNIGLHIEVSELQPGDLVFYNTMRQASSHVGIYLGNHLFVHSPSRGGSIRVESTSEPYWKRRFNGARRISYAH